MTSIAKNTSANNMNYFFISILIAIPAFYLNLYLLSYYFDGDRYHYGRFFDSLTYLPVDLVQRNQRFFTGSGEPIYGYSMWLSANFGLDHNVVMSLINTLLVLLLIKFLVNQRAKLPFIILLFTNYYLLVLLMSAERLKLAFLILMIAIQFTGTFKRLFFISLVPLTHAQMIGHLGAMAATKLADIKPSTKIKTKTFWLGMLSLPIVLILTVFVYNIYGTILFSKIAHYSSGGININNVLRIMFFMLAGLVFLKFRMEFFFAMLVICACTLISGSDRFQISALGLFCYYAVIGKQTGNIFILSIMLFFSYKSVSFIESIFTYGHGFGHVIDSVAK